MPKDLYCQLDIFLRIFLWLRYRWYKSGIHGRCWGAAACLRNSCLDVFHCRSFYQSSMASLYPLNMAILLFSSYVSLPCPCWVISQVAGRCHTVFAYPTCCHQNPPKSCVGMTSPITIEAWRPIHAWAAGAKENWLEVSILRNFNGVAVLADSFDILRWILGTVWRWFQAQSVRTCLCHRSTDPSKDMDRMGWISLGSLKSWSKVSTHDAKAGWDSNPSAHAEPCRGARAPDQRRDFWQLRHASQHENLVFLNFLVLVFRKTCILWFGVHCFSSDKGGWSSHMLLSACGKAPHTFCEMRLEIVTC